MSDTVRFVDYVRADSELRRAYIGMLEEERVDVLNELADVGVGWEGVCARRGALRIISLLKTKIIQEERDNAARRTYDERAGRRI